MRKNVHILLVTLFLMTSVCYGQGIVINEFMSLNSTTIADDFGDYSDWIELYNNSSQSISLNKWFLSDDETLANKWQFPDITIPSNEFLLIFCSSRDTVSGFLHTNFKLDHLGETLILSDSNVTIIDLIFPIILKNDNSYARITDGNPAFSRYYISSPGSSNSSNIELNDLNFSHDAGFYELNFQLGITSQNPTGQIYYTKNGNEPLPGTPYTYLYQSPISILEVQNLPAVYSYIPTTPPDNYGYYVWIEPIEPIEKYAVIRARVFENDQPSCNTQTNTYFINTEIGDRFSLPVLSIIADSINLFGQDTGIFVPGTRHIQGIQKSGNYFETGIAWEKPAVIEYFSNEGELLFEQDLGIRIHGNLSRAAPQKGLQFFPRSEYSGNDELNYPFFENRPFESYKRIIGRSIYSAHLESIVRDEIIHEMAKDLDVNYQAWQPAITFVNGEYWGLQVLREKQNEFYLQQHVNANPDSVDIIDLWGVVENGNLVEYYSLISFVQDHDISIPENYNVIKNMINIPAYIDYYITEIFFNNRDWPGNNYTLWRPQGAGHKWEWFLVDLDNGMVHLNINNLRRAVGDSIDFYNPEWSTFMFKAIMQNEEFQEDFLARIVDVVNNEFSYENTELIVDKWETIIGEEVERTINRWQIIEDINAWEARIDEMRYFLDARSCLLKEELESFFEVPYVNIQCETSILNPRDTAHIQVYPNPVNNVLNIAATSAGTWELFSITGKSMNKGNLSANPNGHQIELSALPAGIYILGISNREGYFNIKVIKSR